MRRVSRPRSSVHKLSGELKEPRKFFDNRGMEDRKEEVTMQYKPKSGCCNGFQTYEDSILNS